MLEIVARKEMSILLLWNCEKGTEYPGFPCTNQAYMIYQCLNHYNIIPWYFMICPYSYSQLHLEFTGQPVAYLAWYCFGKLKNHRHSVLSTSLCHCAMKQTWQLLVSGLKDYSGQRFPAASNRPCWVPSYYLWLEWCYVESPPSTKTSVKADIQ